MQQIKYLLLLLFSCVSVSMFSQIVDNGKTVTIQNVTLKNGESFYNYDLRSDVSIGSDVSTSTSGAVVLEKGSLLSIDMGSLVMKPDVSVMPGAAFELHHTEVPVGNKQTRGSYDSYWHKLYYATDQREGVVFNTNIAIGNNKKHVIDGFSYGNFSIGADNGADNVFMIKANNGNIGIGINYYYFNSDNSSYQSKLNVGGDFSASNFLTTSDARLKSSIKPLEGCSSKLLQLTGKKYGKKTNGNISKEMGLIAQDVEKLFPEVVSDDGSGFLSIDYMAIIPLIIETVKEQQAVIKKNQEKIDSLK